MSLHPSRRSFISFFLLVSVVALSLSACSKGGGNGLHVKSPAVGEKDLAVKSGYSFAVTKSFTDINQKITTAVVYNVFTANYDLDSANFGMTLEKPMTSDDQMRVVFSLVGEEGTKDPAPLKAGTYSAKADKYMKVETVGIVTRKGNADTKTWFDRNSLTRASHPNLGHGRFDLWRHRCNGRRERDQRFVHGKDSQAEVIDRSLLFAVFLCGLCGLA